jgi:predicted MFS family arabinose efflux permease
LQALEYHHQKNNPTPTLPLKRGGGRKNYSIIRMNKLNQTQKIIAIVIPGILLSAPAFAHGKGLFLLFIGLPFLAALFLVYLGWVIYTSPAKKRFATFIQSLVVGAFWMAIFIGPWFESSIENVISDYEISWTFIIPLLLFIGSLVLRKHSKKN